MTHELWRTEPDGILSAELSGYRLVVQASEQVGGLVHFLILRRGDSDTPEQLIRSGSENDVRAAMTAAEQAVLGRNN
jgi:hypothetical protein